MLCCRLRVIVECIVWPEPAPVLSARLVNTAQTELMHRRAVNRGTTHRLVVSTP